MISYDYPSLLQIIHLSGIYRHSYLSSSLSISFSLLLSVCLQAGKKSKAALIPQKETTEEADVSYLVG